MNIVYFWSLYYILFRLEAIIDISSKAFVLVCDTNLTAWFKLASMTYVISFNNSFEENFSFTSAKRDNKLEIVRMLSS